MLVLWFTVWTLLVAGTLVGAFFLGRDLWRKATALGTELGRAAQVLERLSERTRELTEAAALAHPVAEVVLDDPEPARARRAAAAQVSAARRAARAARREATFRRWWALSH